MFLIHYRMLKVFVRHGTVAEKIHENSSFKQSKLLEKTITFDTERKSQTVKDFEKDL